mgnify:CR=1 FL=1
MIILVTGGRDYANAAVVDSVLSWCLTPGDILVHGCATGADQLCAEWCYAHGVHAAGVPALWDWERKQGNVRVAGHKRNNAMLLLQPELCIVFPGGRGTMDMARKAGNAGVKLLYVKT